LERLIFVEGWNDDKPVSRRSAAREGGSRRENADGRVEKAFTER
jgi:hypothetical protein